MHPDDRSKHAPEGKFHREVVSFTRRGGRLTERQQKAWDAMADTYVLEVPHGRSDTTVHPDHRFDAAEVFGRKAPLIIEIGSGRGESLVHAAAENPEIDFLGLEVYVPGVGQGLVSQRHRGVTNIRWAILDVVPVFTTMLEPGSVHEVRTWFPDPWHKKRHNKRRLITLEFASLVARVLEPGGYWRMATDWADYADQMHDVLAEAPEFDHSIERDERFVGRPITRFEAKGLAQGRTIHDLSGRSRLQS